MPRMDVPKNVQPRKANPRKAAAPKAAMNCRKCGKPMEIFAAIEKVTMALLSTDDERAKALEHQLVLCEHCEQPYGYLKRKGKLVLITMTPKWLSRQSVESRKSIALAIAEMKRGLEQMRLTERWVKRMEKIV